MMDYETSRVLNRDKIRDIAELVRKMFNVRTIKFPVMKVLDKLEKKFSDNLYYCVEEDDYFEKGVMSELETEEYENHFCIRIRQSVYDKALQGDGASIGFICHEMCHFILIYVFGIGPRKYIGVDGISYARCIESRIKPSYKSMEWQCMALCGELMIPYDKCKNFSLDEIINKTNSSKRQAQYFISHIVEGDDE